MDLDTNNTDAQEAEDTTGAAITEPSELDEIFNSPSEDSSPTDGEETSTAPTEQSVATEQAAPDLDTLLNERMEAFKAEQSTLYEQRINERFGDIQKVLDRIAPPQQIPKSQEDLHNDAISRRVQEVLQQRDIKALEAHNHQRLEALAAKYPDDFKEDSPIFKKMSDFTSGKPGVMTPEDLYFAANRVNVIQQAKTDAITEYKANLQRAVQQRKANGSMPQDLLAPPEPVKSDNDKTAYEIFEEQYDKQTRTA